MSSNEKCHFIIESMDDGTGRYLIINTEKCWFIPMESKISAEFVCERFKEVAKEYLEKGRKNEFK